MIIAESDTAYRFITQPAHARLAGQFARQWGAAGFERPDPFAAVLAAVLHDDGWWRYDRRPRTAPGGDPLGFTRVPVDPWIDLYDRGIEGVIETDRYAGLLVSMHGTGLRRRRYGLSPTWPDTPPAFEAFVDRHEAEQRGLLNRLVADGDDRVSATDADLLETLHDTGQPPPGNESRLWVNYELLQAWDSLSLSFCTEVTGPDEARIEHVPRGTDRPDRTVTVRSNGDEPFRLDPFPFETDPLRVTVASRTVAKDSFVTESELIESFYRAAVAETTLTLQSVC